eukprot:1320571-Alexandrium_andersonii.AAC.1
MTSVSEIAFGTTEWKMTEAGRRILTDVGSSLSAEMVEHELGKITRLRLAFSERGVEVMEPPVPVRGKIL